MAAIDAAVKESRANAKEDAVSIVSGAKEKVDRTLVSAMGLADKLSHPMDKQARKQADERAELRKADVSAQQAVIRQMAHERAESERLAARFEVADILARGEGKHRYLQQPPEALVPPPLEVGGISAPQSNPPSPTPADSAVSAAPPHADCGDSAVSAAPPHADCEDSVVSAAPPHVYGTDSAVSGAPPHVYGTDSAVSGAPPDTDGADSAVSAAPPDTDGADSAVSAAPPHPDGGGTDLEVEKKREATAHIQPQT